MEVVIFGTACGRCDREGGILQRIPERISRGKGEVSTKCLREEIPEPMLSISPGHSVRRVEVDGPFGQPGGALPFVLIRRTFRVSVLWFFRPGSAALPGQMVCHRTL
jgi:hypothetical protein